MAGRTPQYKWFLPEPDDTRPNPRYSHSGAPMRFYLISRVKRVERAKAWQAWKMGAAKRSAAAQLGVMTREEKLLDHVHSIDVTVPSMSVEHLAEKAIAHYNDIWSGTGKLAFLDSAPAFLTRVSVNYLRHQLTAYEEHLDKIGKTGACDARTELRSSIYDAIADAYPHLAEECREQCEDRRRRESLTQLTR